MDEVEIQLGREKEMLATKATEKPYERLDEAYAYEAELSALIAELSADIERKQTAETIDSSMAKLKPSIDLKPHLDSVTLRPRSAHDVERWRERTDALLQKADDIISNVDHLRNQMVQSAASADIFINKYAEDVDEALQAKQESSVNARIQIQKLLEATKTEIKRVATEAATLEAAIEQKAGPLKYDVVTTSIIFLFFLFVNLRTLVGRFAFFSRIHQ